MTSETLPIMKQDPFHLVIERSALLKALAHCQGIVERRNTVPILGHLLLESEDNTLKITATDLEITLVEAIPARVNAKGRTTVSAHLLFDVVRKLPEGAGIELRTSEDGSTLTLKAGRSNYTFSCLPPTDFPFMATEDLKCTFKIHAAELSRLIDKTRFAMSTEETRYYLNGIFFHATNDGFLRAVATDGLRLAQAQIELPPKAAGLPPSIISKKTIHEVRKLIDEIAEEITVSFAKNQVQFQVAGSLLISRLIEGKFPEYENVIPVNNDKLLEVDVKAFADAVDRISIMSTDKLRPVKIQVKGTTMHLSAHSTETGSGVEEIEVKYGGDALDFGFNARYVLDVAQQVSGEHLQFLIGDATQAIIAKDEADAGSLYVLMPMRI